jgi:hypothetical protein
MWISKLVPLHRSSGAYRGAAYNAELPIRDELLRAAEVAEHRSWFGPCCRIIMFVFFFDKRVYQKRTSVGARLALTALGHFYALSVYHNRPIVLHCCRCELHFMQG